MSSRAAVGRSSSVSSSAGGGGGGPAAGSTGGASKSSRKYEGDVDWWWAEKREQAGRVLNSATFDVVLCLIIICNAVLIGIESSWSLTNEDTTLFKVLDAMFLVFYIVELSARFFVGGFGVLRRESWVRFDFALVVMGVLDSFILDLFFTEDLGPLMVLRMARLLRLARTLRMFAKIPACCTLVRGFVCSASIMACSFVALFFIVYVLACVAVELVTKHALNELDDDFRQHTQRYFHNLPQTMLTLVRFVSLDSTSEVYQLPIEKDPWLALYFMIVILAVSLVMFNLIGAVVFSCVLEQHLAEQEANKLSQEAEWFELIKSLKRMFIRLDADGSGTLSREELMNIEPEDKQLLTTALGVSSHMAVFNKLDVNNTGQVPVADFVNIVWDVVLKNTPFELKRMEKQVETMDWRIREMFSMQHEFQRQMISFMQDLTSLRQVILTNHEAAQLSVTASVKAAAAQAAKQAVVASGKSRRSTSPTAADKGRAFGSFAAPGEDFAAAMAKKSVPPGTVDDEFKAALRQEILSGISDVFNMRKSSDADVGGFEALRRYSDEDPPLNGHALLAHSAQEQRGKDGGRPIHDSSTSAGSGLNSGGSSRQQDTSPSPVLLDGMFPEPWSQGQPQARQAPRALPQAPDRTRHL